MRTLLFAVVCCLPTVAQADQETSFGALQRTFELPAHRGLQRTIKAPETVLEPFTTDGCSGGLSSTWAVVADIFPGFADAHEGRPPWEACCVAHDRRYHDADGAGSPDASFDARLKADEELRSCVRAHGETNLDKMAARYDATPDQVELAYRTIADAMFNAVRFGGGPCTGLPWRWGYGYPQCLPSLP
ncbi:hypothetical protein [Tropicimonas sp. S265A]|uniref:hypothetical protein n=1 Tax=Tropicimonas sp. S265A TaxID=3415134 RepID=UPI003C7E86BA